MIKYEFKKVIKNRFFIVLYVLFIVCDIFIIYDREQQKISENQEKYVNKNELIYSEVKGVITNEKIEYIKNENSDIMLYGGSALYKDVMRAVQYEENTKEICENAEKNIKLYKKLGIDSKVYENSMIAKLYSGRYINEYYDNDGVDKYFTYDYSTLFSIILIIISVAVLYDNDRKYGMDRMIKTTLKGQRYISNIRMLVIISVGIVNIFVFRFLEYIVYDYIYKFEALYMPLYSVKGYEKTFLNISIQGFLVYDLIFKIIGIIIFMLLLIGLSKVIKSQGIVMSVFIIISVLSVMISMVSKNVYTPICMFDGYVLVKSTELINIGGICLTYMSYVITVSVVIMLVEMLIVSWMRGR